jgi:hypothetical protein
MSVIGFLALIFGFTGLMLLDGQTFSHAVMGIACGVAAIGSGLACSRKDYARGRRRWGGWVMAILGLGLAVFCVIQLPSAYRFQKQFNTRSKEYRGRNRANPSADFHALGFDNAIEAGTLFDTYKDVFVAKISGDYWEDTASHDYSFHHFKASVTKSYKGDLKPGEKVSFLYGVDARALTVSNTFVGNNMLLLMEEHPDREVIFSGGTDFFLVDTNIQQILQLEFPEGK